MFVTQRSIIVLRRLQQHASSSSRCRLLGQRRSDCGAGAGQRTADLARIPSRLSRKRQRQREPATKRRPWSLVPVRPSRGANRIVPAGVQVGKSERGAGNSHSIVRALQSAPDRLHHCLDLFQYFGVPESHHGVTSRLEVLRALSVVLVAVAMMASVQFDDQVSFDATEVGDVRPIGCWRRNLGVKRLRSRVASYC